MTVSNMLSYALFLVIVIRVLLGSRFKLGIDELTHNLLINEYSTGHVNIQEHHKDIYLKLAILELSDIASS